MVHDSPATSIKKKTLNLIQTTRPACRFIWLPFEDSLSTSHHLPSLPFQQPRCHDCFFCLFALSKQLLCPCKELTRRQLIYNHKQSLFTERGCKSWTYLLFCIVVIFSLAVSCNWYNQLITVLQCSDCHHDAWFPAMDIKFV